MTQAEENRLQFVANEVKLGFTFIESSQLSYRMGHDEHGQQGQAKAEAAYRGGLRMLEGNTSDRADSLRGELEQLRVGIAALAASLPNP